MREMKKMKKAGLMALTGLLCLTGFTSCEYKDLCYDHNPHAYVRVAFDWTQCPEADPQGMTVLFYDGNMPTSEPVRYDFAGRNGGTARMVPGLYQAVAYNNDTETILYRRGEAIGTLEAYTRYSSIEEGTQLTRSGMPRAAKAEDEPVILEPDPLWAASSDLFQLSMSEDTTLVTLQPTPRYAEVEVVISNVPNLQYTGQFGGALSGLSPGVMMASGRLLDGRATQAFPCQVIDATTLRMRFRIFGHCPHADQGEQNLHLLTIYAILADGSKWYYTLDVTQQIHDAKQNPDRYHISISLDGLPVPKPIVNGSGFQPTIDGWKGEEIEVTM